MAITRWPDTSTWMGTSMSSSGSRITFWPMSFTAFIINNQSWPARKGMPLGPYPPANLSSRIKEGLMIVETPPMPIGTDRRVVDV